MVVAGLRDEALFNHLQRTREVKKDQVPPRFHLESFDCPHCGAYAHQLWNTPVFTKKTGALKGLSAVICAKCKRYSLWLGVRIIFPEEPTAPMPSPDMPEDVKEDYWEAMFIHDRSPRSSAALLRLALQKLCRLLADGKGKNLEEQIECLLGEGMPAHIQKAMEILRVTGNKAVSPGMIDAEDDASVGIKLFKVANLIVQNRITEKMEIESLFENTPPRVKMLHGGKQ